MQKLVQLLFFVSVLSLVACAGGGKPAPTMTTVPGTELTATNCLEYSGSEFCPVWETTQGNMRHVEYLRDGESLKSWTEMLTIRRYGGVDKIKDVLSGYVQSVRPMMALQPEFYTQKDSVHEEQVVVFLVLKAPDNSVIEVVTNSFYNDGNGVVWSVFHSYRMPFSQRVDFTEVMKQKGAWIDQVATIDAKAVLEGGPIETKASETDHGFSELK